MAIPTNSATDQTSMTSAADTFRLARFVAVLALDLNRLEAFIAEPEEEMTAADLTDKEKALLRADGFNNLRDYLWEAGQAPVPSGDAPPDK